MSERIIKSKYTCLLFGEGRKDKNFLNSLIELSDFSYKIENWNFRTDNAHGGSAKDILIKCKQSKTGGEDLILCFIDLDDLKNDYPNVWKKEKIKLEENYKDIIIIWQIDCAEDEYKKVIGGKYKSKNKINKIIKEKIQEFKGSDFWKRIRNPILEKQKELENKS